MDHRISEVLRRRDGDDRGGSNLPRDDRRVGQRTVVDGHIDALLHEIHGTIATTMRYIVEPRIPQRRRTLHCRR